MHDVNCLDQHRNHNYFNHDMVYIVYCIRKIQLTILTEAKNKSQNRLSTRN